MADVIYPAGPYAVRLPQGAPGTEAGLVFSRCLALVHRLAGEYDRADRTWYVAVLDSAQAAILADLAGLGATVHPDGGDP